MPYYLNVLNYFCRTCMRKPTDLTPLFDDPTLAKKIAAISSVTVNENDGLPKKICEECVENINLFYNFRTVIINNDLDLKERLAAVLKNSSNNSSITTTNDDTCPVNKFLHADIKNVTKTTTKLEKRSSLSKELSFKSLIIYRKKSYECKPCNFVCNEISKWQNHKRTKHVAYGICNICGKSMRADNLHKHIKAHTDGPIACKVCDKVLKNSESLRSHSIMHNSLELLCSLCGKSYRYKGEYNRHLKRHSLNGKKTVKCPHCEKLFFEKKYIKKHLQTHTGDRPHICGYCRKGFSSTYALKTHIRQHTNEKPYICEHCSMAFKQKVSLMTHIKSKHTERSTQCSEQNV